MEEMEELCAEEGLALQGFRAQEHRADVILCWKMDHLTVIFLIKPYNTFIYSGCSAIWLVTRG